MGSTRGTGFRFEVDAVEPATTRASTHPLGDAYQDALFFGLPAATPILTGKEHPLLLSVHTAFAEHRPLVLAPDAVWITIAQGIAQHVRLNAESLRSRLVRHEGKKRIVIEWPDATPPANVESWKGLVDRFRGQLEEDIGGLARLFVADFSTTTEVDRIASEVVLLDAFSPYYDYYLTCICGIPEVTLEGTPDDWKKIRARLDVVRELDLAWWVDDLLPIADQLIETSLGRPDRAFWKSIYKPVEAYGPELITGWIAKLYPYLEIAGRCDVRNPSIGPAMTAMPGISASHVPASLSRARITCVGPDGDRSIGAFAIDGGLLGVEEDDEGRLSARAGFLIRRLGAAIEEIAESIVRDHQTTPRDTTTANDRADGPEDVSAEIVALFDRFASAELCFGEERWVLRAPDRQEKILFRYHPHDQFGHSIRRIIDLPDGTYLGFTWAGHGNHGWVRGHGSCVARSLHSKESALELAFFGPTIAPILAHALETNGDLLAPIGTLGDQLDDFYKTPQRTGVGAVVGRIADFFNKPVW
jgi:hypothetical protein